MANEIGDTEVDKIRPEVWRPELILALYDMMQIAPRVLNVSAEVASQGDIVHIPLEPTVSVNDVTAATGAITNQALTPTEVQLTVDQWRHAAVEYTKKAHRQSFKNWFDGLASAFAKALGQDIESKLLDQPSGLSSVGATDSDVGEAQVTAAIQKLLQNKLPIMSRPGEFTFVFDAGQYAPLKREKLLADAAFRGSPGVLSVQLPDIYGIPTYLTNQVEASGSGKNNLLFHREWAAWAIQRNMDVSQRDPSDRLSTVLIVDYLAGFKQVKADRAISILSAAN